MMNVAVTEFHPNYEQEQPGEFLKGFLDRNSIKVVDFAKRCGRPTKTISEILAGKTAITPETAIQFERVLGVSAAIWINLEARHQLQRAKAKATEEDEATSAIEWARCFPIKDMINAGFFRERPKPKQLVDSILRAFGVSSIDAWRDYWENRIDFARLKQRPTKSADPHAVAVWFRKGELIASETALKPYSEQKFRSVLPQIRALTCKPWAEIEDTLVQLCASAGVTLVLIPFISKTYLRGAAYWAAKDKPVIILSDNLKKEAYVWFAFFHECAHILLHSKKTVFLDQDNSGTSNKEIEDEADKFSAEFLIPNAEIERFIDLYGDDASYVSGDDLDRFSSRIGVSSALLLVRLQHDGVIPHGSALSKLTMRRVEFSWER